MFFFDAYILSLFLQLFSNKSAKKLNNDLRTLLVNARGHFKRKFKIRLKLFAHFTTVSTKDYYAIVTDTFFCGICKMYENAIGTKIS